MSSWTSSSVFLTESTEQSTCLFLQSRLQSKNHRMDCQKKNPLSSLWQVLDLDTTPLQGLLPSPHSGPTVMARNALQGTLDEIWVLCILPTACLQANVFWTFHRFLKRGGCCLDPLGFAIFTHHKPPVPFSLYIGQFWGFFLRDMGVQMLMDMGQSLSPTSQSARFITSCQMIGFVQLPWGLMAESKTLVREGAALQELNRARNPTIGTLWQSLSLVTALSDPFIFPSLWLSRVHLDQGRCINLWLSENSPMGKGDFGGNAALDVWVIHFAASQPPCIKWSPQHTLIAKDHPGPRSKSCFGHESQTHIPTACLGGLQEQVATNVWLLSTRCSYLKAQHLICTCHLGYLLFVEHLLMQIHPVCRTPLYKVIFLIPWRYPFLFTGCERSRQQLQ